MKVKFYINDDGGIVASLDGNEMELCSHDWISEFPEDACEQMTERFQKLLDGTNPTGLSHERRDWPSDLKMVYDRNKGSE